MNTVSLFPNGQGSPREPFLRQTSEIPHCPNPSCPHFANPPKDDSWYWYHGKYTTKVIGTITRYQCSACKKTFSFRTFHIDYYTKKTVDYEAILGHLVTSTGGGNTCRLLGLREDLLLNRYERLCQVFMAIHSQLREQLIKLNPDLFYVLDGFESFSHSQYHPNNINVIVGSGYEYLYGLGLSVLKRKGSMTKDQKETRDAMESVHPTSCKETFNSVANLLQDLMLDLKTKGKPHGYFGHQKILLSDKHPTYPGCLRKVDPEKQFFHHVQISSKKARNYVNPLFPVNYFDRQVRKDQANHVRETVQFARCPQAMMTRMFLYLVYHNYISPYRIKKYREGDRRSRSEWMGLNSQMIRHTFQKYWGRRVFFHKVKLWAEEEKTWKREWRNPDQELFRRVPKYIFV